MPRIKYVRFALLAYLILLGIMTHTPAPQIPDLESGVPHIDKMAHVAMYVILSVLLLTSRICGLKRSWLVNLLVAMVLAAGIGAIDEVTQPYVGRSGTLGDWIADLVGIGLAGCASVLTRLRGRVDPALANGDVEDEDQNQGRFVGQAMLVSALTLLSRFTGLARDAVLARLFGLAAITDAFYLGFIIPNLFRRLFGEGALTSSFIPVYTDLIKRDKLTARRLATLCIALMVIGLGAITVLLELLLAGMLAGADWSTDTQLAIRLCMIMLPYMPLVCVVALIGGILQVHGRFGPPATAPILLNLVLIAAAVLAASGMKGDLALRRTILIVAFSVIAAGVIQLIWVVGAAIPLRPLAASVRGAWPALRQVMITMGPMIVGLAVFQINTLLDSLIAWGLAAKNGGATAQLFGYEFEAPIQTGGVTALQFAQRLYQFPLGVFGIALATAIFPALAHAAAGHRSSKTDTGSAETDTELKPDWDRFQTILRHGLRLTVFIGLPASVGLILVRQPLVRLIFERGQFDPKDTARVATILIGYASAVWAYSMTHVVTRAFYAVKNAKTPLRVSVIMVVMNLILNLILVWPLGAAGLAWSSAITATIGCLVLLHMVRRYVDQPIDKAVVAGWIRTLLLTAVMAGALLPIVLLVDFKALGDVESALVLLGMTAGGALIMMVGAKITKAEELTWLLKRRAE